VRLNLFLFYCILLTKNKNSKRCPEKWAKKRTEKREKKYK